MNSNHHDDDGIEEVSPVAELAEAFLDGMQAGRLPNPEEFLRRAGDHADELRPLLATICSLEAARNEVDLSPVPIDTSTVPMPAQLGDYRILREAGRGGMGVVYEAIESSLNRRVAIKILDQRVVRDPVAVERFQRETRAAATLHHTNIVPVFTVGEERGIHFYVMPFIEGQTLLQVLQCLRSNTASNRQETRRDTDSFAQQKTVQMPVPAHTLPGHTLPDATRAASLRFQGTGFRLQKDAVETELDDADTLSGIAAERFSIRQVALMGLQIADAIAHAAQQGILHRDIKPSNLMQATDGTLWMMDFGLARFAELDDLTCTGEVLGTPRYLAPERLRGQHTVQGDIYSVGMVLYELLTLRSAFETTDRAELIRQIVTAEPRPPRTINSGIPKDLETIVLKCLAKEATRRYQTPQELMLDLQSFLGDRAIASRRASSWELMWRWCRRNPGMATLLGSVLLLLSVISAGAVLWGKSLKAERDIASLAEERAKQSQSETARAMNLLEETDSQLRQNLYRAYLEDMQRGYHSGSVGQKFSGLESLRKLLATLPFDQLTPEQQHDVRTAAVACLGRADLQELQRIRFPALLGHEIDIHPDFELIAIPGENNQTTIRKLNSPGEEIRLVQPGDPPFIATVRSFSPCGRWLHEVLLVDQAGPANIRRVWDWKSQRKVLQQSEPANATPAFDRDGRFFFAIHELKIEKYDLHSEQLAATSRPGYQRGAISLSSDGQFLAVLDPGRSPVVLNAKTLESVAILDGFSLYDAGFWGNGRREFYVGTHAGTIELWKPFENVHWTLPHRHAAHISSGGVSPDGRFLYSTAGGVHLRIRVTASNDELITLPGKILRFSSDSQRLAVQQDDELVVCLIVPSRICQTEHQSIRTARFSPDGSWLMTGGNQGVLLYATNPLEFRGTLGLDQCGPVAWHPDGTEIATFGMFSHLARWPVRIDPQSKGLTLSAPSPVLINPMLSRLGADDNVPQRHARFSVWTSDGKTLYFADQRHDRIWMYDRERNKSEVFASCNRASELAVSSDGRWLASTSLPTAITRVWKTATGECVLTLPEAGSPTFSTDGRWMAVGTIRDIQLFNTATWKCERKQPADSLHKLPYQVAFQPHTSMCAASISENTVRLFDAQTNDILIDLPFQQSSDVESLTFNPDGTRLIVVRDGTFDLWNLGLLAEELLALGIPVAGLPQPKSLPRNGDVVSIDRGRDLLPENEWWKGYELLAKFEAIQGRFSDAIGALSESLHILRNGDDTSRCSILTQRADYYLAVGDPNSAHGDLMDVIRLRPGDLASARKLAELKLFGPLSIRNLDAAESLYQQVCDSKRATPREQLHRLLLVACRNVDAARQEVTLLNPAFTDQFTETDLQILELIRAVSAEHGAEEKLTARQSAIVSLLPQLNALDRERLNIAEQILLERTHLNARQ